MSLPIQGQRPIVLTHGQRYGGLGTSGQGQIFGQFGNETLTNVSNTIQGTGNVGVGLLAITNQSVINANVTGKPLTVQPNSSGVTNTATLEATSGATLNLVGTFNNSGGTIQAVGSGSIVETANATINGGTLTTTTGGLIQNSGGNATLNGVTISSGSTFQGNNNSTTFLTASSAPGGTTLTNSGTLQMDPSASQAIRFAVNGNGGTLNLAGGGVVNLGPTGNGQIYGNHGNETLVNKDNTIEGTGNVGVGLLAITNEGTILANVSGKVLAVQPNGSGATNNGTFQANSGSLLFMNGTLTNYNPGISTLTPGLTHHNSESGLAGKPCLLVKSKLLDHIFATFR